MSSSSPRYQRGDIVVGDWAWGGHLSTPHPVIATDKYSITLGVDRTRGGWLTTARLLWNDVHGAIAASTEITDAQRDLPADVAADLGQAVRRVHRGYLDAKQREALAHLLLVAGRGPMPTPVTAVLHQVVQVLRDRPHEPAEQ